MEVNAQKQIRYLFGNNLEKGIFLNRPNRFIAEVEIDGNLTLAHVADPGRLKELLVNGTNVYLLPKKGAQRKTKWQLLLVESNNTLVSLDSQLPNKLIKLALLAKRIQELTNYNRIRPEFTIGKSRFDFALYQDGESGKPQGLLEVKSVTLVEDGLALFPDAPTLRGVKHLNELIELSEQGYQTAVLFLVQRSDATVLMANKKTDPLFASTLKKAKNRGVSIFAYSAEIDLFGITLLDKIEVIIE